MKDTKYLIVFGLIVGFVFTATILTSPEFQNGGVIPGDYGCDIITGEDRDPFKPSPPLEWVRIAVKTQSFVLLVDDMDNNLFVHWLVINIPRNVGSLDTDASGVAMPDGSIELKNSYGIPGWGGPCPLNETHLYRFRLFSMNTPTVNIVLPQNASDLTSPIIENQLADGTIYVAVLTGFYRCPKYIPLNPPPIAIPTPPPPPLPIPIVRYFKPSESFRASKNIHEIEKEVKCRPGQDDAQSCLPPPPPPEQVTVFKAPFFPFPNTTQISNSSISNLSISHSPISNSSSSISNSSSSISHSNSSVASTPIEYKTISTDPYSQLSEEEILKRYVRPGGLEPINPLQGPGALVPIAIPNIQMKAPLVLDQMANAGSVSQ